MRYLLTRSTVLVFIIFGVAACGGNYKIEDPIKNSIHSVPPAEYVISYKKSPEELPQIILNGHGVTEYFTQGQNAATAQGTDLAEYLVDGKNRFQIDPPLGPKSTFIYDTKGPEVVILEASNNTVKGLAIDDVAIDSLYMDNVAIELDENGGFTTSYSPSEIYSFAAEDELGHSSLIQFRNTDTLVDNAVKARVNQGGLNFVAAETKSLVNNLDFNALVAGTEIYSDVRNGPLGTKRGREGHLTNLNMKIDKLELVPTNNGIRLTGTIKNVYVKFRLVSYLGILPDIVMKPAAIAPLAFLNGLVDLETENGKPKVVIKELKLDLALLRFTGALGVFDAILQNLISNTVTLLDRRITNKVREPISNAINNAVGDLIPSNYAFDVNGVGMNVVFDLSHLSVSNSSIDLAVSGGLNALSPSVLIPDQLGSRYFPDDMSSGLPNVGDLGVAINTNVINQGLASAFKAGITHLNIQDGNVNLNLPRDDSGAEGDTRVLIDPVTAPYVSLSDSAGEPLLELTIRGLQVQSQKLKPEGWQNNFNAQLSAAVKVGVSVAEDNTLDVSIDSNPKINFHSITVGQGTDLNEEFAEGIITDLMPTVMNVFSDTLKGLKIPALGGYVFTVDGIQALGENDAYLGISGSMSKAQ